MCKPYCPLPVSAFVSAYEGPYPEGPGSFAKCGGSAEACLVQAGFSADNVTAILTCNGDNSTAIAALKKMEAYGEVKFNTGKGFPQTYVDDVYYDPSDTLPMLCKAFASANFTGKQPPACGTFKFLVDLKIQWPLAKFDKETFATMLPDSLSSSIVLAIGGNSIVQLITSSSVGVPTAVGGKVVVHAQLSILDGFKGEALRVPGSPSFAAQLAGMLNRSGHFPNITGAAISASASPALPLQWQRAVIV